MDSTGIIATTGLVISILGSALAVINHTRVRSMCCGKKLEVSFDVEKTTPPAEPTLKIQVPGTVYQHN